MREQKAETRGQRLERYYDEEINSSLARGLPFAVALGGGTAAFCLILLIGGLARDLIYPATFGLACALYATLIVFRARAGQLSRHSGVRAMLPFTLFPTAFFVIMHFVLPSGTASYITGPISYIYLVIISLTGFFFDPQLSIVAGFISGGGYLISYLIDRAQLAAVVTSDPVLHQDLSAPSIYVIKALVMIAAGFVTAAVSVTIHALLERSVGAELDVEDEQQRVEAESRRRRLAESLRELVSQLTHSLDLAEVAGRLTESLQKMVALTSASALIRRGSGFQPLDGDDKCAFDMPPDSPFARFIEGLSQPRVLEHGLRCTRHSTVHDTVGWLALPLLQGDAVIGLVLAQPPAGKAYSEEDLRVAGIFSGQAAIALQNAVLYEEVRRQATIDELTQIFNRRHLVVNGERLVAEAVDAVSVVSLDVDHFKKINDTYGHPCGDSVLREVVARCRRVLRPDDVFGRCGGEEFGVVLRAGTEVACAVAERMRAAVAATPIPTDAGPVTVTISLGVASSAPGVGFTTLWKTSDEMLYAAKHGGRNRVCHTG